MNKLYHQIRERGFTIIEVVLVLAIAGLIFLMVFIALPALQSNQRDTSRKNEVGTIVSYVTTYASNNRGSLPPVATYTTGANAATSGFGATLKDVSGAITAVYVRTGPTGTGNQAIAVSTSNQATSGFNLKDGEVAIYLGSKVGTSTNQITQGTSRQFVVCTYLEANGGTVYCQS